MLVIENLSQFKKPIQTPVFVALGNFDGIHLGHQSLLKACREKAKAAGGLCAVFTFYEHPQQILNPQIKTARISSNLQKILLLQDFGIDICFLIHFTPDFSKLLPEDFVKQVLLQRLGAKGIFMGEQARFGYQRKGNALVMKDLAEKLGFEVTVMPSYEMNTEIVSSSKIRSLIEEGRFQESSNYLGRNFSWFSKVIRGEGRGGKLGFPTANLDISELVLPPNGVYPVMVRRALYDQEIKASGYTVHPKESNPWLKGVLNLGVRPTFGEKAMSAEVFIMDFNENIYGEILEVVFYPNLRSEKKFQSVEELKTQILKDIESAKEVLPHEPKNIFTKVGA